MRIIDIPRHKDKKELLILDQNTPLMDAIKKMKKMNYGAVIVTNNDKLCGIFTERDLLMKIVAENKEIASLSLKHAMTRQVQTAKIDDTVYDAMRRMTEGKFRHLPLLDENGKIVGLVSQGDFVALDWSELFMQLKERTRASFFTHTQFWMFVVALMIYVAVMVKIFK